MPLRVLIVEDEPLIALDLEGILEDEGHDVVGIASTMEAALRFATSNSKLDLAVMDVELACEPDGVEAARRLRTEHGIASLFVSAQLDDETRVRALEWAPIGFVAKPFVVRDIRRALDAISSRR